MSDWVWIAALVGGLIFSAVMFIVCAQRYLDESLEAYRATLQADLDAVARCHE